MAELFGQAQDLEEMEGFAVLVEALRVVQAGSEPAEKKGRS